jgi:hypothetical protein
MRRDAATAANDAARSIDELSRLVEHYRLQERAREGAVSESICHDCSHWRSDGRVLHEGASDAMPGFRGKLG